MHKLCIVHLFYGLFAKNVPFQNISAFTNAQSCVFERRVTPRPSFLHVPFLGRRRRSARGTTLLYLKQKCNVLISLCLIGLSRDQKIQAKETVYETAQVLSALTLTRLVLLSSTRDRGRSERRLFEVLRVPNLTKYGVDLYVGMPGSNLGQTLLNALARPQQPPFKPLSIHHS